ncbi:MAG: T9SS type A sorting domain-containing protein [candidate division WOR-3 bacterium]
MLALILAISLFVSSDTMEVKGTRNIIYRVFVSNQNLYFQYKAGKNWSKPTILDSGNCYSPSIAVTPGDYIHIVWQRDVDDGKIFYKTTLEKVHPDDIRQGRLPEWSEPYRVSYYSIFPTEPASNPFVEAYGEYVYAAWRGPNENGEFPGDIWRRARKVWAPPEEWLPPENKSKTRDNESNYPVMSTNFVTVWQEQVDENNWDIWGKFETDSNSQPLFQTEKSSKYPHINSYWDPNPNILPTFYCNTIWTEKRTGGPPYELRFGQYKYVVEGIGDEKIKSPPYYIITIGEADASPYCINRDGYLTYGSYSVDYGDENLKYKLPYLNPQYDYLMRAIVYRTGVGNWLEDVYVDSTLTASILSEPYQPETVWINVPKEFYEYDAEIEKEIEKIIGRRALIADLRLYQVEVFDSTGTGNGPQSAGITSYQRPILYQSYPNPFKSQTKIRYTLPAESKVTLSIYDVSGRLVKTLINKHQTTGTYSINWDGKDNDDRTLAQGVYFYRLTTANFSTTKRLVFIK